MKDAVAHRMIEQACELYPQMADKIDFIEIGTPVTNKHYIGMSQCENFEILLLDRDFT